MEVTVRRALPALWPAAAVGATPSELCGPAGAAAAAVTPFETAAAGSTRRGRGGLLGADGVFFLGFGTGPTRLTATAGRRGCPCPVPLTLMKSLRRGTGVTAVAAIDWREPAARLAATACGKENGKGGGRFVTNIHRSYYYPSHPLAATPKHVYTYIQHPAHVAPAGPICGCRTGIGSPKDRA